ncbi:hypothetical protein OMAG_002341 [Candidatus Omnitrophus magneticus]|uniref:Uncharacterized protein n=1 Tax=Candidatus Omnitrophus magneticus TaxID=1609969 RepID=A0A0F0CQU0_9BACT|nr:hypothetical protein OMAG_002341 [Candidatus Omnitrophus magneticus]
MDPIISLAISFTEGQKKLWYSRHSFLSGLVQVANAKNTPREHRAVFHISVS